ncbi:M56 family metallopeptidase [Mucilaginibacter sp. AW1-3]
MKATFLNPYFSDHAVKAVCWTLLHSLWIGVIVAALAGLVIALTKKSAANLRYRLLCGLLMVFVGLTAFVFYNELNTVQSNVTVINLTNDATGQTILSTTNATVNIDGFSYTRIIGVFNQYSGWIFALWLLCFAFKSVKLVRELLYVKRVRSSGVFDVDEDWRNKVLAFSQKLGIKRVVKILESERVNVPVTVGYLKPVILLPLGMMLQLSPGQIESIIYHELAHILRRDYLMNILQSVVETVFFFNPAIWWLSALIRDERETCCDDIVLAHVSQKRNYLEALMAFQNYEAAANGYAMGLSLRKNQLMNRLRRMVSHENKKLNAAEKLVLLSGIMLLSLLVFIPKAQSEVKHGASFIKKQVMAVVNKMNVGTHALPPPPLPVKKGATTRFKIDTLKKKKIAQQITDSLPKLVRVQFNKTNADSLNREVTVTDDINNNYYLKTVNGKLTAFTINDVVIPEAEYAHYQPMINHINQLITKAHDDKDRRVKGKMQLLNDKHNSEIAKIDGKRDRQAIRDAVMGERDIERNMEEEIRRAKDKERNEKGKAQEAQMRKRDIQRNMEEEIRHAKDKERNEKDKARGDRDKAKKDRQIRDDNGNVIEMKNENDNKLMVLRDGKTGDTLKLAKWKMRKGDPFTYAKSRWDMQDAQPSWDTQDAKPTKRAVKPRGGDSVGVKKKHHVDISGEQKRVRDVIAALVEEKVVANATDVDWFGLSNDELIVNGTKQPETLHQKLKARYGISTNNGLYYGPVKMYGTGVFLDKRDLSR